MRLAESFGLPVITLIDTAGAYPGLDAEERGQAEAIARNLIEMAGLRVPIVVAVTGEGGSGGALALGVGDRVLIFEYAVYSVISPEGCAAILWKDQEMKAQAAEAMRITAPDLLKLGVVDEIVSEPAGGVHTDPEAGALRLGDAIERALKVLEAMSPEARVEARYRRFRALGVVAGTAGLWLRCRPLLPRLLRLPVADGGCTLPGSPGSPCRRSKSSRSSKPPGCRATWLIFSPSAVSRPQSKLPPSSPPVSTVCTIRCCSKGCRRPWTSSSQRTAGVNR